MSSCLLPPAVKRNAGGLLAPRRPDDARQLVEAASSSSGQQAAAQQPLRIVFRLVDTDRPAGEHIYAIFFFVLSPFGRVRILMRR